MAIPKFVKEHQRLNNLLNCDVDYIALGVMKYDLLNYSTLYDRLENLPTEVRDEMLNQMLATSRTAIQKKAVLGAIDDLDKLLALDQIKNDPKIAMENIATLNKLRHLLADYGKNFSESERGNDQMLDYLIGLVASNTSQDT